MFCRSAIQHFGQSQVKPLQGCKRKFNVPRMAGCAQKV